MIRKRQWKIVPALAAALALGACGPDGPGEERAEEALDDPVVEEGAPNVAPEPEPGIIAGEELGPGEMVPGDTTDDRY